MSRPYDEGKRAGAVTRVRWPFLAEERSPIIVFERQLSGRPISYTL